MEEIPYDKLPLGFRFRPTDEQLIIHYLKRKINGTIQPSESWVIPEIDVCRTEPWDLPSKWRVKSSDLEWFFFAAVDRKYPSGNRSNRATENGYWKATGKDRLIKSKKVLVGMKKTLVFHIGRAPRGTGSCWIMHEYRVVNPDGTDVVGDEGAFVLCRLFKKDKDILKEEFAIPISQASPKSDLSDEAHRNNPENTYGQITEYNVANDEMLPYWAPITIKPEQSHSNSDITADVGTDQGLRIKQEEDSLFDGLKDFLGSEYDQNLAPDVLQDYTIDPNLFEWQLCNIDLSTSHMVGAGSSDSDNLTPIQPLCGKPVHRAASKRSHRAPPEMHEPIERPTYFTSNDGSLKASGSYETEINIRHRAPESSNNSMDYVSHQGTAERRIKLEKVRRRKAKKNVEIEPPMATSVASDQSSISSNDDGVTDTNDLKVESPTSGYWVPMHKIAVAVLVIVMMLCAGTIWLLTS